MKIYRFWTWTDNRWQGIALSEDCRSVEFSGGGEHEEGHSYWRESYSLEGEKIVRESESWGRDCDGPHSAESTHECSVDELESTAVDDGTKIPNWTRIDSSQRDYFAEAAGY